MDDIKLTGATLKKRELFLNSTRKGKLTSWYNWHGAKPRFDKDGEIRAAVWARQRPEPDVQGHSRKKK